MENLTPLGGSIYLIQGYACDRFAWHYVIVNKLKLPLFLKAAQSGSMDVTEYGKILYSGWGKTPPRYIIDAVEHFQTANRFPTAN